MSSHSILHEKIDSLSPDLLEDVEKYVDELKAKSKKKGQSSTYLLKDVDAFEKTLMESKTVYGAAKGLFVIKEDFNEPLDDLKDYMG